MKLPTLLLGGEYDFEFPVETSQRPLFILLGTPAEHKRHVVFENAGHVPPRMDVIREALDWLDRYLGPVHPPR
jgi:pimeloyl-ACP methyl ester carboxylesterase